MRKTAYCILFLLLIVALTSIPKETKTIVETPIEKNAKAVEPGNINITLKKGEYYILKVNITNDESETLQLKGIEVQSSDITQIINTTHPLKWLMPSNETWALILFNTSAIEPETYSGWVRFVFESSSGTTSYSTISYSLTVQPFDPLIRVDPPYLHFESLGYEESIIKFTVENLVDVNLTVALQIPSELDGICIPLKNIDTIPPKGHAEYPVLIKSWKVADMIVEELNFTVLSPVPQTWRTPVALISHEALNVQNFTLLEKHVVLENNSKIVNNGTTETINFNVPVGVHQLLVIGDSDATLEWELYDPARNAVPLMDVNFIKFSVIDPMPGTWNLTLDNMQSTDAKANVTLIVSASDIIGGTDLLKEEIELHGYLLGGEDKIVRFYVPPGVSSLNIFTGDLPDFTLELYDPFGRELSLTETLFNPIHGTYTVRLLPLNPSTEQIAFSMKVETPPIEEFNEIPVVITDFIKSKEAKIFKFYVPPGVEAFSLDLTTNASLNHFLKSPSCEEYLSDTTYLVESPEHGVWSFYVEAPYESAIISIVVDEVIAKYLGTPPLHVTGRIDGTGIRIFRFWIPYDTGIFALNGSSTTGVGWKLFDPSGEIQYFKEDVLMEISVESPKPGAWKLEIESFESTTFSFEVVIGNQSFSKVKIVLEESFLISTGESESGVITIQNFGNETLKIMNVETLDPWVSILDYDPSEIASSTVGSVDFEVDAENCTYGIYHSFVVIESSWGKHFAEVSMEVLLDLVKVGGSAEILTSNDVSSVTINIFVQNIGVSNASILNVPLCYHISERSLKTGEVSVISNNENSFVEGLNYILPNITVSFGSNGDVMNFFATFVIVKGRSYKPNFTGIENIYANIVQNSFNGLIDEPFLLSVNVTNEADYSTGKVVLWNYVVNDFYLLPASVPSIQNGSFSILSATVRFTEWTKENVRLLLIVENSSGELVCIASQNVLSIDIEAGLEIVDVWYIPETPMAHDYIAVKAKLGEYKTSIFTVSAFYMYDNQRETLHMATSEGSNVYSGMLKPFMQPVDVNFVVSAVANGRLGFFISDNNGNYYNMKVRTSPPPEEFDITVFTDRPAYRSGSKVLIAGNVTREGSLLINVFVNIKVLDPNGTIIAEDQKITNETGYFAMEVQLAEDAIEGIYQVNVTYGEVQEIYEFWVDNTPPFISGIEVTPENPRVGQEIVFEVQVQDNGSGIERVVLSYNDGSGWVNITMDSAEGGYYFATLPPLENETTIKYKVYAWDLAGNIAYSEEREIEVLGEAKPWSGVSPIIIISLVAVAAVVVFLVLKRKK